MACGRGSQRDKFVEANLDKMEVPGLASDQQVACKTLRCTLSTVSAQGIESNHYNTLETVKQSCAYPCYVR